MLPLLKGERESIREELFAEVSYHAAYEPKRAVRTERYKYIRRFDGRRHRPCSRTSMMASPRANGWTAGYGESEIAPERLV